MPVFLYAVNNACIDLQISVVTSVQFFFCFADILGDRMDVTFNSKQPLMVSLIVSNLTNQTAKNT